MSQGSGFYITPPPLSSAPLRGAAADVIGSAALRAGAERGGGVTDYRSKSYQEAKQKDQPVSGSSSKPSGEKTS